MAKNPRGWRNWNEYKGKGDFYANEIVRLRPEAAALYPHELRQLSGHLNNDGTFTYLKGPPRHGVGDGQQPEKPTAEEKKPDGYKVVTPNNPGSAGPNAQETEGPTLYSNVPAEKGEYRPTPRDLQSPQIGPEAERESFARRPTINIGEKRSPFPYAGLHIATSYEKQPDGTTRSAQNARSYDPETGRKRGAQRAGLSKYMADAIEADEEIQDICHITYSAS